MEGVHTSSSSGGPAPFLLKTYDMIDDSSTDEIVSWSNNNNSFVVWNPPEFARLLLPMYFKHNNFSSFIRQLNTYGFRKIDPEKWEFANEEFLKDQKHLLKNIHRRKPIHSHSQPQDSLGDTERAAFDEEIERLSREKSSLQANVWTFKQQQSTTKLQLKDLELRVHEMEQRQFRMRQFLAKSAHNPTFVEHLVRMAGSSMNLSAYNKKRRLPNADNYQEVAENSFVDNHSGTPRLEFGNIIYRDFYDKLKLELSPAVSDSNLVCPSTQSSNEDSGNPQREIYEGEPRDVQMRSLTFSPETVELSDTGTSFALKKDTFLSRQVRENESPMLQCLEHSLNPPEEEEGDAHISCHLNLTLASSSLQVNNSHYSARIPQGSQQIGTSTELMSNSNGKESDLRVVPKNINLPDDDATAYSSREALINNQGPATAHGRVNDLFWEQFLTERPGSSDTEDASPSLKTKLHDEQEERKTSQGKSWRNVENMEKLTL
ncbi:hypothetical protein HHK36_022252 [Tetracentron sinense]|uniref:HSF-type DNA-binding domain-containing protein n=1 Tax=Tetracentron sinense TaxID=13715 RepID=A0A834YU96_TETSI|nr:hypothetical protein HHK36_022252 [Tetracentron sinense]